MEYEVYVQVLNQLKQEFSNPECYKCKTLYEASDIFNGEFFEAVNHGYKIIFESLSGNDFHELHLSNGIYTIIIELEKIEKGD